MHPKISVLITDLDNTLFDWVDMWACSFGAMLEILVNHSGIARETLIGEIKEIHQRHGTSEYAFLIEEIPSLKRKYPDEDLASHFSEAIDAYRTARKKTLKLYPGVAETLSWLKSKGVCIVAYTESMAFYTNYRIRNLCLDGVIDCLYSPPDHELPANLTPEQIRKYPAEHYDFQFTKHKHTPQGEIKPNPDILKTIIADIGVEPKHCLYVGDSLMKDIVMAQAAGVHDAYALYGKAQDRKEYQLLRDVTHWTPEQVEKEKQTIAGKTVTASHVLSSSLAEILAHFDFVPFKEGQDEKYTEMLLDIEDRGKRPTAFQ